MLAIDHINRSGDALPVLQLGNEADSVLHFLLDALQLILGSLELTLGGKVGIVGLIQECAGLMALRDQLDNLLL